MQIPTMTVTELSTRVSDMAIVDVRETFEYSSGHVPGAINIPMSTIPVRLQDLPEGDVCIICESGGRSWQVAAFLAQRGIVVTNVEGGTGAWRYEGFPIEHGHGPTGSDES
ncbi:MAG: rhodanese-like domain-containing protein [Candidatus Nanopelagicales bacterium]|jgi:rhodanese-related sulfurtransferase|nr:rhodanese-like domain-containing protein [Candidatus Nanopelagicales bacterium]MDP4716001.1 rhodanese-like domain-containing protein [Candidatus Nanopelagicales bacterium]MDP4905984.1 rhodanese-like domain-containing protein [Candidatus Nanopelagicales bacterium]MDP4975562.1 rhodanese-like domain-containing protein [Candidatus Nanopelagicales bacterium]MDP5095175.1 rhodanese-like domain-containing protein [Candidatus Nanopelagicales bacterium]